jgi:hypothetical protein
MRSTPPQLLTSHRTCDECCVLARFAPALVALLGAAGE